MFSKLFKNKEEYKFSDPKNTACMVCSHVLNENAPILYVSHDAEDGMWQFLCGSNNHTSEHAKIIALSEAVLMDGSVNQLYEMPLGVGATRETKNGQWQPFKL